MAKLLIVDDEVDVREFAKRFFSRRGVNVDVANGGRRALEIIEENRPDLVLLDIQMEEMDGIEVLKILKDRQDPLKVIMVTGNEAKDVIEEVNQYNISGYIHKPLVLEELEKIVLKELGIEG